jgi:hypothetical protein
VVHHCNAYSQRTECVAFPHNVSTKIKYARRRHHLAPQSSPPCEREAIISHTHITNTKTITTLTPLTFKAFLYITCNERFPKAQQQGTTFSHLTFTQSTQYNPETAPVQSTNASHKALQQGTTDTQTQTQAQK